MRKRIVIGLLAIIGIGVLVFVVSQPKKGTVDYHVREYRRAYREMTKGTLLERTRNVAYRIVGKEGYVGVSLDLDQRVEEHRTALIRLGYLEKREFVVSNRSVDYVIHEGSRFVRDDPRWKHAQREFILNSAPETNVLVVIAKPDDMPIFVEAVRKADIP